MTGSFKFRAAYFLAASAPEPWIIAASSGNFGQALALACSMLGKGCTIVMPDSSAAVKIAAVRDYGAEVELIDVRRVSRAARVAQLAEDRPGCRVASAYDDDQVIAGNATLGAEIAAFAPRPDIVVAPVGGGGLTAGLVQALGAQAPGVEVVGAEPLLGNDAARSLRSGRLLANDEEPATLADGARTVSLGERNWAILRHGLAGIVEVPEVQIREAVRLLFSMANVKSEPTGALAIGALLADPGRFLGRRVCCVVSGGNVDPAAYAEIITGD